MKKEMIICIILTVVSFVLCAVGYIVLPDTVVIQIGMDGNPSNTVPKLIALIIPFALNLIGTFGCWLKKERKYVFVSAIGVLVGIITVLMNK